MRIYIAGIICLSIVTAVCISPRVFAEGGLYIPTGLDPLDGGTDIIPSIHPEYKPVNFGQLLPVKATPTIEPTLTETPSPTEIPLPTPTEPKEEEIVPTILEPELDESSSSASISAQEWSLEERVIQLEDRVDQINRILDSVLQLLKSFLPSPTP